MLLQVSFQISAVLRPDPSFPILDSIQGTRLVPLFWATEGFTEVRSLSVVLLIIIVMIIIMPIILSLTISVNGTYQFYDNI